jgi:putative heme-binding domain-containing protein
LQTGPDGAVYVIDWCDTQHCHNPDEEKWDRSNGRIYRISWKETYKPVKVDLGAMSDSELAGELFRPNEWRARTAQRLLQERVASTPGLSLYLGSPQDMRSWTLVRRMMWADHAMGVAYGDTEMRDDIARSWAIQLATEQAGKLNLNSETLLRMAATDPSPTVRLALASALPNLDAATAWKVASALAMHGEDKDDRFLPKMIWFGLARVIADDWSRGLALADTTPLPSLADSIRWYAAKSEAGREALVTAIASQPDEVAQRTVRLLAFGLKDEAKAPIPKAWPQVKAKFASSAVASTVDQLSALFGDKTVLAKMRGILSDDSASLPQRRVAFDLLKRTGDAEATPIFAKLLDHPAFSSAVIPLLSRSKDPATAQALIQRFATLNDADRSAALNTLSSRAELALPLLAAVKAGEFDKKYLSALQIRQMRNLNHAEVNTLLDETWGKTNESSAAAKATVARIKKSYESAPLWAFNAKAGEETFKQLCAVCHAMGDTKPPNGGIGPDLAGSWRNGLDYFLENIVDPNAVVGENFQLHVLTKKDGSVVPGVIQQETDTAITVRTVTEPVVVSRSDLKDHQKLPASLLPPGLLEALSEHKRLELLKFLLSKKE